MGRERINDLSSGGTEEQELNDLQYVSGNALDCFFRSRLATQYRERTRGRDGTQAECRRGTPVWRLGGSN